MSTLAYIVAAAVVIGGAVWIGSTLRGRKGSGGPRGGRPGGNGGIDQF